MSFQTRMFALSFALLSSSALLSLADNAELPLPLSTAAPTEVDVLIIGAGWAGMAAADHLARNGPGVHFAVLESTNRTGGRSERLRWANMSLNLVRIGLLEEEKEGNHRVRTRQKKNALTYPPIPSSILRCRWELTDRCKQGTRIVFACPNGA